MRGAGLLYEGIGRPSRARLMQALILVGGEGTRLRPLTASIPKPVVTLVDRPFLAYMLEWLAAHGVDDVVLSCGFKADRGARRARRRRARTACRIPYREEPSPLGTGGALKFCEDLLDERFLMLNGDVLTDIDLTAQIAQHEAHRRDRHAGARARPRPEQLRARAARRRVARARVHREARRRTSASTRSRPAPTCSSARCSTCSSPAR